MPDKGFAARLALVMRDKRITQVALSTALEVSQPTVSGWLAGSMPRRRTLRDIAEFLNVDLDWLKEGKGNSLFFSVLARPDWAIMSREYLEHPDDVSDAHWQKFVQEMIAKKRLGFGERIHFLRKGIGLGLDEFAARCGVTPSYISRLEGGSRINPSVQIVDKVMTAFPVMRFWLLYGDPPILCPDERLRGEDERIVAALRAMEREEVKRYNEFRQEFIRKLATEKKFTTAAMIASIELHKEGAANNEHTRKLRDLMVDVLMARVSSEGAGKANPLSPKKK